MDPSFCHTIVDDENSLIDLPVKVFEELCNRNWTLSTIESCTGGLLAHQITQISGASAVFRGSIVAYCNEVKEQIVGVSHDTILRYGAVSSECVHELLNGAQQLFATDVSIAISGIAGPTGGSFDKPVGTVWIGVQCGDKRRVDSYFFGCSRELNILLSAENAWLQLLSMMQ